MIDCSFPSYIEMLTAEADHLQVSLQDAAAWAGLPHIIGSGHALTYAYAKRVHDALFAYATTGQAPVPKRVHCAQDAEVGCVHPLFV